MNNDFDITKIYIDTDLNNLIYAYGQNLEDFRSAAISLKNKVNELIENLYQVRYIPEVINSDILAQSPNNIRYCQCVSCGSIKPSAAFLIFGGKAYRNYGMCRNCLNKYERGELDEESISRYDEYMHRDNDYKCIKYQ